MIGIHFFFLNQVAFSKRENGKWLRQTTSISQVHHASQGTPSRTINNNKTKTTRQAGITDTQQHQGLRFKEEGSAEEEGGGREKEENKAELC